MLNMHVGDRVAATLNKPNIQACNTHVLHNGKNTYKMYFVVNKPLKYCTISVSNFFEKIIQHTVLKIIMEASIHAHLGTISFLLQAKHLEGKCRTKR